MKSTTKRTIRNVFASLISNDAAIEGAKTAPWWIAIVMLVIGTFLPIIPIMVNASKTYGASFLLGNTYGYEQALVGSSLKLKYENYEFTINENKELIGTHNGAVMEKTWVEDADLTPINGHYLALDNDGNEYVALDIYYSDRPYSSSDKSIKSMIKQFDKNNSYYIGTTIKVSEATEEQKSAFDAAKTKTYTPSYLILYKTGMYSKIYKYNSTSAAATTYEGMDWKKLNIDVGLIQATTYVLDKDGKAVAENPKDTAYVEGVMNNWKAAFNRGYLNQKTKTFWFNSGLYYGIYIVLAFFMGLLMFLLTRGKNNPNRNLNLWIGFKISMWIDFTPGLLAMILGFVFTPAAGVGYIALIGIRTMWLSMRQLNPTPAQ